MDTTNIKVIVLNESNEEIFQKKLQIFLDDGYQLKSSSVGFVNSELYDFCGSYQALLIKGIYNLP